MDQDNSNSTSINFAPSDPTYAPINSEGAMPAAAPSPIDMPTQPTSVSDQIAAFGQAQQAASGLEMAPIAPQVPAAPAPQFAQPLPDQNLEAAPMIPAAAPIAAMPASLPPAPDVAPIASAPVFTPPSITDSAVVPTAESAPAVAPASESAEPTAVAPAQSKKSSFKSVLILIAVFVVLFGLAALLGYALGFKAGQASMPGM